MINRRWPELGDRDWLQTQLADLKDPVRIADLLDCPAMTVMDALINHGLIKMDGNDPRADRLADAEWLHHQYVTLGKSTIVIANELSVHPMTVRNAMERHQIPRRANTTPYERLDDPDWLRDRYETDLWTQAAIARHVGCTPSTVRRALKKHGISQRPPPDRSIYSQLNNADWLHRQYVTLGQTLKAIAAEIGCAESTVRRALAIHGIARRGPGREHAQ